MGAFQEMREFSIRTGGVVPYKWVVELTYGKQADTKYVRATTKEGAILTARDNSYMPERSKAVARPATPEDLGCVLA